MMYRNVIVGWDGTEGARDALALARMLREVDGTITAASVSPEPTSTTQSVDVAEASPEELVTDARAEAVAALAYADAGDHSAWLETVAVPGRSAAEGLRTLITGRRACAVVVGSSRHGPAGLVHAGGVGRALFDDPPCRVALPPKAFRGHAREPRCVAVAFDGSHQLAAVDEAAAIASSLRVALNIYCLVPPLAHWGRDAGELAGYHWLEVAAKRDAYFHQLLAKAATQPALRPAVARLLPGRPLGQLLAEATRGADLLVIGARASGALQRVAAGITAGMLQSAPCPVLMIPAHRGSARPTAVTDTALARTSESASQ